MLGAAAVFASTAACGGGTPATPLVPVVTPAQGAQIAQSYATHNNQANRTRDAALLGRIETNPLLEVSLAGYEAERVLKLSPDAALTFAEPHTFAPSLEHYPHWFVSFAHENGDRKAGDLSVFVQVEAAAPWRKALDVGIGSQSVRPVVKNGAAQPPPDGFSARTATATKALATYLQLGPASPSLDVALTGAVDFRTLGTHLSEGVGRGGSTRVTCTDAGPAGTFLLGTADGELLLTSLRCTIRSDAGRGQDLTLSGSWRGLTPDLSARRHTIDSVHLVAVSIPTKGPARVLGDDWDPVSVIGS